LVGQVISLIKDTSLSSIVGVIEFTRAGEIISERTFHDFEVLLVLAIGYWVICYSLSRLGKRLECTQYQRENLALKSIQA
jgi:polar amino acid transport system permease protein